MKGEGCIMAEWFSPVFSLAIIKTNPIKSNLPRMKTAYQSAWKLAMYYPSNSWCEKNIPSQLVGLAWLRMAEWSAHSLWVSA
jgi:hypothetical protein